ncbi:Gfo/Idh/MocA family oxidoreductase [Mesorhizobium sp.]|uniref:Gfo/Idh/MocA family protein n=1 Tax=Mesorhizobium sp. TaxID=1871066 RepID=UPI000FE5D368|nr:Gfo/Idh/MocA family oxidoreductase [Mesorhizobium sp.]RWE79559.1 MAG: Gfo/Idh/MocA family oxidoreductase [Mesorhizobium sp.]
MSDKIRVGVIGAGNWALHGHLRVLSLLPEYEIVGVYARRQEAAEKAAKLHNIKQVFASEGALVSSPDVDMVAVLNTAPQHAASLRLAIAAGKNVYSEWPLTTNTATAEELVKLANDAKVRHAVGLQRRIAPNNRYVRDLIRRGYIGKIRSVRMHISMNYLQAHRTKALAWTAPPENFSGVVQIYAGHFLDMLFAAVGKPVEIYAHMVNQFDKVTIVETGEVIETTTADQLVLSGDLGNNAVLSVHIEGGKRNGSGVQIDITGDAGDLRITNSSAFGDLGEDYLIEGSSGNNEDLKELPVPASYNWLPESNLPSSVLELANLYAAFARGFGGDDAAPSLEDGLWLHRLFDAFARSNETGRRLSVRDSSKLVLPNLAAD